ncbi:hypothetical protein ES703_82522 [subsurface metagenome]
MKRFSLILILAGVALALAPTQLAAGWARTYGGEGYDAGFFVLQTDDGGYIVLGSVTLSGVERSGLFKTDALGNILWTKSYGGSHMQITSDGGYIIVSGANFEGRTCLRLLKTDANGDTIWTRIYHEEWGLYAGYWVEETDDGGYIVSGRTGSLSDAWFLKTDEDGDILWTRMYRNLWRCSVVRQTSDGGYIFLSGTFGFGTPGAIWLLKTDSQGDSVWARTYCGEEGWAYPRSVEQTPDGGYVIVEVTGSAENGDEVWLLKTDSKGDTLWTRTIGSAEIDWAHYGEMTRDGGCVITGHTQSSDPEDQDLWLIKTNENGDTLWTATYGGAGLDWGFHVRQTSDGGYIITGITRSFGAGAEDLWLIKTEANGDTLAVTEEPAAVSVDWQVNSIGSQIVLRYSDRPQGFHAAIFNASGQKVDELHSDLQASTITWGRGDEPGCLLHYAHRREVV